MKKIFVFGILALILGGFVWAQEKVTEQVPTEAENYQDQIDSLKTEVEKVKKDAYEKAIEGANRSVGIANLVIAFVAVLAALVGIVAYFKIKDVRAEMKNQLAEAEKIKQEAERYLTEIKGKGLEADAVLEDLKSRVEVQKEIQPADFTKEVAELTKKDASEAVKIYEQLFNRIFGADVYWAMAYNYYKLRKFEKCIIELMKYIEIEPEETAAYNNWGIVLDELGRYDEATEKFRQSVKLDPKNVLAYYNWGTNLLKFGKLKKDKGIFIEGLEKLDKVLDINKQFIDAWYNKACAHSLLEDKNKALENLKRAIELDSKYKEEAKEDKDFEWLWEDPEFKKLVE